MASNCDTTAIDAVKVGALMFTLAVGLLGSLSATRCGSASWAFRAASMYAAGQFVGVAIMHLAWAADATLRAKVTEKYPIAPLIVVISLLGTQLADKLAHKRRNGAKSDVAPLIHDGNNRCEELVASEERPHSFGLVFVVILAVHSIFGGLVIGLQTALHMTIINFIAFGAHKGVAGYALGLDLAGSGLTWPVRALCCAVFSVSTPVGVGLGMLILAVVPKVVGQIVCAIFGALSAGSFLYIAMGELNGEMESSRLRPVTALCLALLGVGVMALIYPIIIFPGSTTSEVLCL